MQEEYFIGMCVWDYPTFKEALYASVEKANSLDEGIVVLFIDKERDIEALPTRYAICYDRDGKEITELEALFDEDSSIVHTGEYSCEWVRPLNLPSCHRLNIFFTNGNRSEEDTTKYITQLNKIAKRSL